MILKYPVKIARKLLSDGTRKKFEIHNDYVEYTDHDANELLRKELMSKKPSMIAKFGTSELACILNYLSIKEPKRFSDLIKYIKREKPYLWWWDTHKPLGALSGLFPATSKMAERFSELILSDINEIDILCSYIKGESLLKNELSHTKKINIKAYYSPFAYKNPWTELLEDKKVLVIHPFEESIINQYKKRKLLFSNPKMLPEFELKTIKAVQTIANNSSEFNDWFEALNFMKNKIDKEDFDIAIIGCGAYGLPLAAHVKRGGKKAIHLAGWTQILFGIYGKRWEKDPSYKTIINEHWVKPLPSEVPINAKIVEHGCYW